MADGTKRYLPQHRNTTQAARSTVAPRWFIREAVQMYELVGSDIAVFYAIADNLSAEGVSRSSNTLLAQRTKLDRGTVGDAVARLVRHRLVLELDEKRNGAIMRYGIPEEMPWPAHIDPWKFRRPGA